jgi:hypothetical protein
MKLARYGSIPLLQINNINILDYDETEPNRIKVKLVDIDTTHRTI